MGDNVTLASSYAIGVPSATPATWTPWTTRISRC
jgi:hypothetical protein